MMAKMETNTSKRPKASVSSGTNSNRVAFELKRKVVVALNKLADRDTYQVGLQDLLTMVESLNPEGVWPFLSCILDTDSDQKNTVRKECVRLMGHLASFHPRHVALHLGKMVSSIVKRLKDTDTVVRDACVETMGIIASQLSDDGDVVDGVFVTLVKPLFEALGEQNKQLQCGSALCMARVIDCAQNHPLSILQQMLNRTIKLLKNPHFVAKPAVVQLNTSIIKAGGAPSQTLLSAAINSIQESLKSSDWNTRKAASVALGDIASCDDPLIGLHRASCIHGLESCRFDKVKPVRETVIGAIKSWQCHPGSPSPTSKHSQASSSFKGNSLHEDVDVSAVSPLEKNKFFVRGAGGDSSKAKFSVPDGSPCQNFNDKPQHSKKSNRQLEIGVSKSPNANVVEIQSRKSVKPSVSSIFKNTVVYGAMTASDMRSPCAGNGFASRDANYLNFSRKNGVDDYCKSKFAPELDGLPVENTLECSTESSPQSAIEEVSSSDMSHLTKLQDRNSFGSTVTYSSSPNSHRCCIQTTNELASIKKQLQEIKNTQSSIIELLQVLTTSTTNSLMMTQSKVAALGNAVDQIADSLLIRERCMDKTMSRFSKGVNTPCDSSFKLSSPGSVNTKLSPWTSKNTGMLEENDCKDSSKAKMSKWATSPTNISTSSQAGVSTGKLMQSKQTRDNGLKEESVSSPATVVKRLARECRPQNKDSSWKRVKGLTIEGDIESAYAEALRSEDELLLLQLLDQSSPALDRLTWNTATNLLTALASRLYQRKNIEIIIPWIQQIIDLSSTRGSDYFGLPSYLKRELLMAIQEAASMTLASPLEKRSLSLLGTRLHLLWGKT